MRTWKDLLAAWQRQDPLRELERASSIREIVTHGITALLVHGSAPVKAVLAPKQLSIAPVPPPSAALLELASAICLHEVVGLPFAGQPYAQIKPLLAVVPTSRDAPDVSAHWNKALIGIVLDEPAAWRGILGLASDADNPFVPNQTFQFNVWGTIRHFVAARAIRASKNASSGAWREFLVCYPMLEETRSANLETLLWMGRLVLTELDAPVKVRDVGDLFPILTNWAATQ
jgi:hypothetical protein